MKTATLIFLSMLAVPAVGQTVYQCREQDGKLIYQQAECNNGTKIDMGVVSKKIIPLYEQYSKIKSIIKSLNEEPQLEQLNVQDIQTYLQKRLDISNIGIDARDLKIRKSNNIRVLELKYSDGREIFDGTGLFVTLEVNEEIPLVYKKK